ncbi:MAG TPA: L-threonine 3-dehydrogenase [Candidatus Acidoferrales bacterium]|nr:L-threonine 3-dehydrogenase [Candidatus Acidoferrales bacterium]
MKAFAKIRPALGITGIDAEQPKPSSHEVLVKVKVTSVCGTDYHIYKWDEWAQAHIHPPRIIGHEFAGEIVEVAPNVTGHKVGDMIAAESHIACGRCFQCRTGNSHICERLAIIGVDVDGSFAEYVKIPEQNAWPIPAEIPLETASVLEPLGNAIHAAFAADIPGSDVCIFGCGPVGLSAVALTSVSGALSVTAIDINEYRLGLAKTMGASRVINSRTIDPVAEIHKDTNGRGAGVVLEMSGNEVAIRNAFKAVRNGGTVILFGLPAGEVHLNLGDDVIFKEAHVRGIVGREVFKTWYILDGILKSRKLNLQPLITHRMPLDQIDEAMKLVGSGECGKILLTP